MSDIYRHVNYGVCVLLTDTLDYWQLLAKVLTSENRGKQVFWSRLKWVSVICTTVHIIPTSVNCVKVNYIYEYHIIRMCKDCCILHYQNTTYEKLKAHGHVPNNQKRHKFIICLIRMCKSLFLYPIIRMCKSQMYAKSSKCKSVI